MIEKKYIFLTLTILTNLVGNHLLKYSARNIARGMWEVDFLLPCISGLLFYFFSAGFYILSLKELPLSLAYPMMSITYVVTIFTSYYLFNEAITLQKITGSIIILLGVYVLSSK
ncbi:MAG: SMR family transporter [Ignavibacteriaceae bacterium]|nr:SMR family transporter [Ignavibacteriaceae bacterium]